MTTTALSSEVLSQILEECHSGYLEWRRLPIQERGNSLKKAAARLREGAQDYARLIAREMGKPVRQGRAEIEKCAWACDYYAEHAERFLRPEAVETDARESYVCFEPMGIILGIMPWNFPFWQVFRAAAPCLMAGNAFVLKHASNVTGCAEAIEEIFSAAVPQRIFRNLPVPHEQVKAVLKDPRVRGATVTGSPAAGRSVATQAGRWLKKTVLELGGSDPYIVWDDADIPEAARISASARMFNDGQSCIAAKRFIVFESVREAFERALVEEMRKLKVGDPQDEATDVGPLARPDLRDQLQKQVEDSVRKGARILLGGQVPAGDGAYYPPTVLTGVKKGMAVFKEETFGPVAAIAGVRNEDEAVRLANSTKYGLGAAVFTRDLVRGERIARQELDAGSCFVNAAVKSDPRLPFGGVKESGYGRELGVFGLREFVNVKTVFIG